MAEEYQKAFNKPMYPTKPFVIYIKKCQVFAADAGNFITMADMVQMGVMHAVAIGVMWNAYHS